MRERLTISEAEAQGYAVMRGGRRLGNDHARRIRDMRERGMSYPAIARWFTNNVTPVRWETVRRTYERDQA